MSAPKAQWVAESVLEGSTRGAYSPEKIFLGAVNGKHIGFADDRHLMTIAGSRAGKGRSCIIPNLLHYTGSVLVVDPKGENANLTALRRSKIGQTVRVLDPFGRTAEHCAPFKASFNPLSILKRGSPTLIDDAALIADALVIPGGSSDTHWDDTARSFIEGLILHVATAPQFSGERHLVKVYELAMFGEYYDFADPDDDEIDAKDDPEVSEDEDPQGPKGPSMSGLGLAMAHNPAADGAVMAAGLELFQKDKREFSAVISTARRHLSFLRSKTMQECLKCSDFELTDLQTDATSIYLCLPAARLSTNRRWLRLFINLAMEAFERAFTKRRQDAPPVLVIMDEFPILGHMRQIEDAAGQIAGYGVKLWPIIQDLSQLKALYKDRWETFLGNAGVIQCFGNNEQTTTDWISKRLGKTSFQVVRTSELSTSQRNQGGSGESWQTEVHDLLTGDEVARHFSRESMRQIIIRSGQPPIALSRVNWDEDEFFSEHATA